MSSNNLKKFKISWELASQQFESPAIENFNSKLNNREAVYTLPGQSNHEEKYLEIIEFAMENRYPIYLSNFMINYEPVVEKLIEASEILKGKIFVITPFEMNNIDKFKRSGNWNEKEYSVIQRLIQAGIRIRSHRDAHWKFVVVGNRCIVSSSNLVEYGFRINPELGYIFDNCEHISDFLKEWFLYIWNNKTEYEKRGEYTKELPQRGNGQKIANIAGNKIKLLVHQDHEFSKDEISKHLKNATERIYLSTFLLTNNDIIDILVKKAKKGVDVRILLPQRYLRVSGLNENLEDLEKYADIKYCFENHSKIILIDNLKVLVSTGNLDGYLEKPNLDLTLILRQEVLMKLANEFYSIIWKIGGTKDEFVNLPSGRWKDAMEFQILIDNPYKIHPKENKSISYYERQLNGTKYIRHYKIDGIEYVVLDKETTSTRVFKLEPLEEGYRLDKFDPKDYKLIQAGTPTYLERVNFEFIWYDITPDALYSSD